MITLLIKNKIAFRLASCLINAQPLSGTQPCHRQQLLDGLHKPQADRWLVASQYTFRWQPVRISVLVWVRSFIEPDVLKTMYRSTIPLYDQSAVEIRVRNLG